ncbi:MAG: hypothetical protein ACM3PW_10800 [Chlamydiota bacterium]
MKWASITRILAIAVLLWAVPCVAQYGYGDETDHWHMKGTVGLDLFNTGYTPVINGQGEPSSYSDVAGDFGLDLSGFLKDPKLLQFDTNFNTQRGATSLTGGDYNDNLLGGGVSLAFLPVSRYPFHLVYRRSAYDTTGSLFGSNTDYSQLNADWTVDIPNLPRFNFSYLGNKNDVRLATSLNDTGFDQTDWGFRVQDKRAGWQWNAAYNFGKINTNSTGALSFITGLNEDYKTLSVGASRPFWGDKALFQIDNRGESLDYSIPGDGTSSNKDWLTMATLRIQHTRKLVSNYFYSFSRVNVDNQLAAAQVSTLAFLAVPRMDTHTAGARVEYQLFTPLRVFQEIRYYHNSPFTTQFENQTSLAESFTGATVQKRLRSFDLAGTYILRYDFMGTNLSNHTHTWSNDVDARVGWGNVRRVHLTGLYRYSKYNYVQQIGGFSTDNRYGVEAETMALPGFRVRGGVEHGKLELLNISGDIANNYTNYSAQIETRKIILSAMRGINDGAGALFPSDLIQYQFITVPLPIGQLAATPLLDRFTRVTAVGLTARLRRNLDLGADWRRENDLLFASLQNYRIWELRGEYRLGKITLDGGVGNMFTQVTQAVNTNGLRINRYYIRIRRDFNFF